MVHLNMDFPPKSLLNSLRRFEHFDEPAFNAVHQEAVPPVSIRFNPGKIGDAALTVLPFVPNEQVRWASDSWYLGERPAFTQDPLFHAGLYYVQEASSMFLEQAFRACFPVEVPLRVLDCCASPGGKSTQLQSLISADSLLLSNEVIKTRVPALYQNLVRWGGANVVISQNDPRDFERLPGFFDLMVVDAPCSGSGLFRKDPAAADGWSEDLVKLCSQRQQRILADTWTCLKEDGFLIYCTCSFSPEEDEELIDTWMDVHDVEPVRISLQPDWNIVETQSEKHGAYGYRFYPNRLRGEGFFLSVLKKKESVGGSLPEGRRDVRRASKSAGGERSKFAPAPPADWLPGGLEYLPINDLVHAVPAGQAGAVAKIQSALYLKKAGILCGKPGAGEWIPDHELALAAGAAIPMTEVDLDAARRYLRKELDAVPGGGRGWQALSYGGLGLGWVKKLSNRINNYYPSSWRILGKA